MPGKKSTTTKKTSETVATKKASAAAAVAAESSSESEAEAEYEVEKIVSTRVVRGHKQYYLKWKGYPESENTWANEKDLNCPALVAEFLKSQAESESKEKPAATTTTAKTTAGRRGKRQEGKRGESFKLVLDMTFDEEASENSAAAAVAKKRKAVEEVKVEDAGVLTESKQLAAELDAVDAGEEKTTRRKGRSAKPKASDVVVEGKSDQKKAGSKRANGTRKKASTSVEKAAEEVESEQAAQNDEKSDSAKPESGRTKSKRSSKRLSSIPHEEKSHIKAAEPSSTQSKTDPSQTQTQEQTPAEIPSTQPVSGNLSISHSLKRPDSTPTSNKKKEEVAKADNSLSQRSSAKKKAHYLRLPMFGLEDEAENIAPSPFSSTKIGSTHTKRTKADTSALGDVTNDENLFSPSPAKASKIAASAKKFVFDLGQKAEKILELDESNGKRMFLIKWFNSVSYDYVPAEVANRECPQIVIRFYEENYAKAMSAIQSTLPHCSAKKSCSLN